MLQFIYLFLNFVKYISILYNPYSTFNRNIEKLIINLSKRVYETNDDEYYKTRNL